MTTGTNIVRAGPRLGRGLVYLGLFQALVLTGCTSSTSLKLEDLAVDQSSTKSAPPPPLAARDGPATAPSSKAPAREYRDQPSAQPAPSLSTSTATGGSDMIVGFKGATVVLFGDEIGQEGERVPTSSFAIPLQMKYAASNISRVQIDTPYGPRWVARSEVTTATDVASPVRR